MAESRSIAIRIPDSLLATLDHAAKNSHMSRSAILRLAVERGLGIAAEPGPIECKVRADVGALVTLHPMGEALSEMAFALATQLDQFTISNRDVSMVNKELRETLEALTSYEDPGDDDGDDVLSGPLFNTEDEE